MDIQGQEEKIYQTLYGTVSVARHVADYRIARLPIGSGVTEAACKILVKQRLYASGMKWKEHGVGIILSLRALVLTDQCWDQFWHKISRYGFAFT